MSQKELFDLCEHSVAPTRWTTQSASSKVGSLTGGSRSSHARSARAAPAQNPRPISNVASTMPAIWLTFGTSCARAVGFECEAWTAMIGYDVVGCTPAGRSLDKAARFGHSARVTDVLESGIRDDLERPHRILRHRTALVVAGLTAVVMLAGLMWWRAGGTHLAAAGGGYGVNAPMGQDASFGIILTKDDGGQVSLDSVSATVSAGATVTWSIYQAPPGGEGFGTWYGALAPRWSTVSVSGYDRVSKGSGSPDDGSTWIVGTVHANAPGVYRVADVSVTYSAGWRTRTASAHTTACVLVYPAAATFDSLVAASDPLVAQYRDCLA